MTKYMIKFSLMHLYSFVSCFITNSESPLISTLVAPNYNKASSPTSNASYSASLLQHGGPSILYLSFVGIPSGEIISIPTPLPSLYVEPLKYNFQDFNSTYC